MAAPATEHVRNIVLVGQDGAGKTSLAEAMLHVSGRTPRMGTTHDGKSYLDYDEEEIRRKFTIGTSIAPIPYHDYKINLLDTSGHPDFIGDTLATMQAAEMALFVVDAVAGPQVMTTKLWREAEGMRLSRAVFINHIDREHANFDTIMAQLHARFGSRLGPVTIPIGVAENFKGVIDVLRMKARYFDQDGTTDDRIEDIPPEYEEEAQIARDKLCDLVAEADDELMMKYLDGAEQLTQEELERLLDKAIAQELFIPVYVGSTIIEQGIRCVMKDICTYFPHPRHHGAFRLADGNETFVDANGEPAAFVFKTVADPFVGRLSYLKIFSGTLTPGMSLSTAHGQERAPGAPVRHDGQRGHGREIGEGRRYHRGAEACRHARVRHAVAAWQHRASTCLPRAAVSVAIERLRTRRKRTRWARFGARRRERPHAAHQPQRGNAPDYRHCPHGRGGGGKRCWRA